MSAAPLLARYTGDGFELLGRSRQEGDARYIVGQRYAIEVLEQRSIASHNHQFAELHDLWLNLPEHMAEQFPSAESLRKFALIKTGYADIRQIVAATERDAQQIAAMAFALDSYSIADVCGCVVTIATAKSQSRKAMGAKEFNRSKSDILDYVASLIGLKEEAA